jgi:hypothetical protein
MSVLFRFSCPIQLAEVIAPPQCPRDALLTFSIRQIECATLLTLHGLRPVLALQWRCRRVQADGSESHYLGDILPLAEPFGMPNNILQETFCFESFKECMSRSSGTTKKRADLFLCILSVKTFSSESCRSSIGWSLREPSDRTTPSLHRRHVSLGFQICVLCWIPL